MQQNAVIFRWTLYFTCGNIDRMKRNRAIRATIERRLAVAIVSDDNHAQETLRKLADDFGVKLSDVRVRRIVDQFNAIDCPF